MKGHGKAQNHNFLTSKQSREKISLSIFFLGMLIIFTFACNNRYLGITEYYYFLIGTLVFSGVGLFKSKIKLYLEHYCCIYLLYILAFNLVRYQSGLNSGVYISYILFILMFLLITLKKPNKREIRFLINSYTLSAFIISFTIIIFRKELDGWVGTYRYTLKFMNHVYIDPNFIAAFINIPAIFCLNRLFVLKRKRDLSLYIFMILIISIAVFLTGSRAAMIALFLGCSIVFLYHCRIKTFLLGIVFLIIIGLIMYKFLPEGSIERMFFNSYNDVSNSTRLMNWQFGLKSFLKKPITGYGFVDTSIILSKNFGYNHAIHNTYINFLNQFGIIGGIPIIIIIGKILIITLKRDIRMLSGILSSLLFTSLMIEQNVAITFWIVLIILYLINNYKRDNLSANIVEFI